MWQCAEIRNSCVTWKMSHDFHVVNKADHTLKLTRGHNCYLSVYSFIHFFFYITLFDYKTATLFNDCYQTDIKAASKWPDRKWNFLASFVAIPLLNVVTLQIPGYQVPNVARKTTSALYSLHQTSLCLHFHCPRMAYTTKHAERRETYEEKKETESCQNRRELRWRREEGKTERENDAYSSCNM